MRTKTIIKFANINETQLIKFKNISKKNIKEKKIFKLKYILNVCLLQYFKF